MKLTIPTLKLSGDGLVVELSDGRTLSFSYSLSGKLMSAASQQRQYVRVAPNGLHWPQLGESFSISQLLDAYDERVMLDRSRSVQSSIKVDPDDL